MRRKNGKRRARRFSRSQRLVGGESGAGAGPMQKDCGIALRSRVT
jgi:hypothetical protein